MKSKSSIKVGCLQKRTLRLFQISSWAGGTWTVLVMKGWPLGMSTSSINIVKLCLLNRTLTWPKADFSKFQIMIFLWKEIYNETILCRTNVLISLSDVWDRCYPMMKQPANKKKKKKKLRHDKWLYYLLWRQISGVSGFLQLLMTDNKRNQTYVVSWSNELIHISSMLPLPNAGIVLKIN